MGGPQGRSGLLRKISSTPGFDSRAVHSVVSRTEYTFPAHKNYALLRFFSLHIAILFFFPRPITVGYFQLRMVHPARCELISKVFQYQQMYSSTVMYFTPN